MPFAQIYLLEGRSSEQKKAVIQEVTTALQRSLDAPVQNVRVWIHEVPKDSWGIAGVTARDLGR